jgi:AAA family ATP:ADP antiporter
MIIVSGLMTPIIRHFFKATPKELLIGFKDKDEQKKLKTKGKWASFTEGIKLLLAHKYLAGIFVFGSTIEFLLAIFDFSFKLKASEIYSGVALSNYFGIYASSMNIVAVALLLFGVTNIPRYLGVKFALILMPILWGCALFAFLMFDSLLVLFVLMVAGRGIKFALNNPTLKQLYIPTSKSVRFKAQAWIDTFESRLSKWLSSLFNMQLEPLQSMFGATTGMWYYQLCTGALGCPLIILLGATAVYLGKTYKKAVDEKSTVC